MMHPTLVKDASGTPFGSVVSISALDDHVIVCRSDGSIWTKGNDPYSQLGDQTTVNRRNPIWVPCRSCR